MAKILIIDDDPMARELLATVLGYAGHTLVEAADGAEGLAQTRAASPDLIIVDLLMPTMDGFEFVRRLRQEDSFANVPVVFYSATYLESEARSLASLCGVKHIITKPAEPQQILDIASAVLGAPQTSVAPFQPDQFHREHLGLLVTKLSQKAAEAVPRLDAMIELSLQFASERNPRRLLDTFCTTTRKIIGARYATVAVLESTQNDALYLFTSGMSRGHVPRFTAADMWAGVLGDVLRECRPLRLSGLPGNPQAIGFPSDHPPVHSFLCAPIASPDRVYGCLCLTDKIGSAGFSDEDEGLSQILAAQVGRIYENSTLFSEVRRRAEALEREVAERIRAEDALRQSEERFSKAFRANLAAIGIHTIQDARIIDVNDRYCDFFGYSREEMIGRSANELGLWASPVDKERIMRGLQETGHVLNVEASMRRKTGEYREALLSIETIELAGEPHYIAMLIDLTGRKRLEEELRQAQKMEAIGQLAGGVAHDFNNVLSVILGNALMIQGSEVLPSAVADCVHQIALSAEHASTLTRQLLMFSRRQKIQPRNLDLNDVVDDMIKMLRRILGEDVKLQFEPSSDPSLICADAGMIEQVLLNLAVNARDAMPKGGCLTITTSRERIDESAAFRNPGSFPGEFACLKVGDTGVGIPAENLAKIFEPFFTTKDIGKGTGLGLATVYGIVKQHGGWLKVDSELQKGTTFSIFLPTVDAQAKTRKAAAAEVGIRGGTESILVVEDHPLLRSIVRKVLERYGYRVLDATSGLDALKVWQEFQGDIQLLLTDVIMPDGMTGRELAEKLTAQKPSLKVIYTSGYSAEAMGQDMVLQEGVNFLQKPYDLRKVAETVRYCLDRGHPPSLSAHP